MKNFIIEKAVMKVCYSIAKLSANSSSSYIIHQPKLPEKVNELKKCLKK